ncbi:protein takeout [Aethina tumida]|uniref:protein takeout n=1 Tax=Aethina tumida TaxID=116153 RepID=UPI00096ADD57|nr:protein takeout [Aethina tumida]
MMLTSLAYLFGIIVTLEALKLPEYIIPCEVNEKFNECALTTANRVIPQFAKGDKKFKIPSLMPLKIPFVELSPGSGFTLKIKNMEIYGLENLKMIMSKTDFKNKKGVGLVNADKLVILGNYEIKGSISVLPVEGKGPLNITLVGAKFIDNYSWNIINRGGQDYIDSLNSKLDYNIERAIYNFQNLFNGDKMLGDQLNNFLNENWQQVSGDMKQSILNTAEVIFADISNKLFTQIPFKDFFKNYSM